VERLAANISNSGETTMKRLPKASTAFNNQSFSDSVRIALPLR
jgi:hypothetical protein